ncbi:hypothetical protein [Lichenicola sp.]|uniref:hypothetical protein n=1 Tax=Lichenicola sp. TaxID=2804529 RepID=UPI003B00FD56
MRKLASFVFGSLLAAGSAPASGRGLTVLSLDPHASRSVVAGYAIYLGGPDDAKAPRAWQGPIRITSPGKPACTVSDDVSIIEKPLSLVAGHLLYVTTYSGNENRVYVVKADDCSLAWTSARFVGRPRIIGAILKLPGRHQLTIDAAGIPENQKAGKDVGDTARNG